VIGPHEKHPLSKWFLINSSFFHDYALTSIFILPSTFVPLKGDGGSNDSSDGVRSKSAYDSQSVHIPYTSLPISDVFAISPRNLVGVVSPGLFLSSWKRTTNQIGI
jgi:hypothetical protein